jgi:hypothetical protein
MDYDLVLEGTVGLELDNGRMVTLNPGDLVVQNGTRHRWHHQATPLPGLAVTVGALQEIEGGGPVA